MRRTEVMGNTEFEWAFPQLRHDKVVEWFGKIHSRNLLDIGCGSGSVTEKIRKALNLELVDGVDILADRVKAPDWLRLVKLDVDKEDLPYPDSSFDAIYCGDVIEHIYDTDHLLDEIYRVLSPTGVCILSTPNLASWINRIVMLVGFQPYSTSVSLEHEIVGELKWATTQGHRTHVRVFTLRALKELLQIHQFSIVRLKGWEVGDLSYYVQSGILSRTARFADRFFALFPSLAYRIGVVIRRSDSNE